VLDLVLADKVKIRPFVKTFALDQINEVFKMVHERKIQQRPILIP
jgi:D-arabinose 1-dehydrogenase-like Zn-dependent alcohol dehydrogenase